MIDSVLICYFLSSLIVGVLGFCAIFVFLKKVDSKKSTYSNFKFFVLFIVMIFLTTSCVGLSKDRETRLKLNLEQYSEYRIKVKYAEQGLPSLAQLGDYKSAQFAYRRVDSLFFSSEGISVFADYDETNYLFSTQTLDLRYSFIDSPVMQEDGDYSFPVSNFSYKDYEFRIAFTSASVYHSSETGIENIYPKSFTMVGLDHLKQSIAYLYFYDGDLDYLCEKNATSEEKNKRMIEIIDNYFCWREF